MIHKGGRVTSGVRDVLVLSFQPGKGKVEGARQTGAWVGQQKLIPYGTWLE